MAFKFPSDEWIKELGRQLNASEAYERSAKDWEGDFIFIAEPDDAYPHTAYLFLGLYHGKSTDAAMVASEDERPAQFVIRAPFSAWRQVIEGKLDTQYAIRNTARPQCGTSFPPKSSLVKGRSMLWTNCRADAPSS